MSAEPCLMLPLTFRYRNYRGVEEMRSVVPLRIFWGATEWYPEPQWLLEAFDLNRNAGRIFALANLQGCGLSQPQIEAGE